MINKELSFAKGIIYSISLNIGAKLAYFFQLILIAFYFENADSDIYFYLISVITLLAGLFSGTDSSVLIPKSMSLKALNNYEDIKFMNYFFYKYLFISCTIGILFYFSFYYYGTFISNFTLPKIQEKSELLLCVVILLPIMIITSLQTSILSSHQFFTLPIFSNLLSNLFTIVGIYVGHEKLGTFSLVAGMLLGGFLNLIILTIIMRKKLNWNFSYGIKIEYEVKKNILFTFLGNIATFSYNYGLLYILGSVGVGLISSYTYSQQIISIPNNFIIVQFATIIGIKFNKLVIDNNTIEINLLFNKVVIFLFYLLIPISFILFFFSNDVVNLLFKRGNFNEQSSIQTATFVKYLIFLLPSFICITFLSKLIVAYKKVSQSFLFQLIFNLINLLSVFTLSNFFGFNGMILGIIFGYTFYITFGCLFMTKKLLVGINYKSILYNLLKIFSLNLIITIVIIVFYKVISISLYDNIWAKTIFCVTYLGLLIVSNFIWKITDLFNKKKFMQLL